MVVKNKEEGMVNLRNRSCIYEGCNILPTYNNEGETNALYCSTHKKNGMIDIKHQVCIYKGCKTRPNYNNEGEMKILYCFEHKQEGMVNLTSKTCIYEGCNKQPTYNKDGEKKALYCVTHKEEGMVNIRNRTCINEGCKIRPTFNNEGETKPLYCVAHKNKGMVNIKDKTCIYHGCKTRPNYNNEGDTQALYCTTHKKDGMVNIRSKTCISEGCKKIPHYNKEGEKKTLYCSNHKEEGMVDVRAKRCKSSWCSTQVAEKYYGYCLFCYINLFPDKPVSRNYKTKEYAVVEYVKTKFPNLQWIADKIVSGGCSKRRPDLLLDLIYQIVIVEIDENQHTDYDCSCENKRIMEVSQDLGHRPIVFIRFNPDDYDKNGTNVTSCWGHNNKGLCTVKKSKKSEWDQRLTALEEQISYWINPANTTNKTIETVQLFYDV